MDKNVSGFCTNGWGALGFQAFSVNYLPSNFVIEIQKEISSKILDPGAV